MHAERKRILWLVSWYPNKYDPFDGDFIQRHAQAAALYDDIHVLFLKQHPEQSTIEKQWHTEGGLTEQIIYLPKEEGIAGKIRNYRRWQQIYQRQVSLLIREQSLQMIHVHIPWKVGLIAIWVKKKFSIPYVLTEHWGIYNKTVADGIYSRSILFRLLLQRIFRQAKAFTTVSRFLGEGVNTRLLQKDYSLIPNVVDISLFFPGAAKSTRFTFLHVSNMVPLKNVEGILRAFKTVLNKTGSDVQLKLAGNRDDRYVQLARELELPDTSVFFLGEVSYHNVAIEMQQAHVLLLNSDMENAPCVISEASCCGLPVIATRVGGVPELVSQENGYLIPPRDEAALATAMLQLMEHYQEFQPSSIAARAHKRFSYKSVGLQMHALYNNVTIVK